MIPESDSAEQLIDKADALMRRHRAYVAQAPVAQVPVAQTPVAPVSESSPSAMEPAPAPIDAVAQPPDDDDLPVLTDIVDSATAMCDATHAEIISGEAVAIETQRWLDEELPGAVLSVLDGLADHLVATITERMRAEVLDALRKAPPRGRLPMP